MLSHILIPHASVKIQVKIDYRITSLLVTISIAILFVVRIEIS